MEEEERAPRVGGPQTFRSMDHFMRVLKEMGLFRISRIIASLLMRHS